MKQTRLIFMLSLIVALPAAAQDASTDFWRGFNSVNAYHSDSFDSVNEDNFNLIIHIPIVTYPQRGAIPDLAFIVGYQSTSWFQAFFQTPGGGYYQWEADYSAGPYLYANSQYSYGNRRCRDCNAGSPANDYYIYGPDLSIINLGSTSTTVQKALDASGWSSTCDTNCRVCDARGICHSVNAGGDVIDRNGNAITPDFVSGNLIDSVGRKIPSPYSANGGLPTSGCKTVSYPTVNNGTYPVTFCVATYNISSNFGFTGVLEYSGTRTYLQSISLPNGTSWLFYYNSWGDISSIVTPTGGTVSYTWVSKATTGTSDGPYARFIATRSVNANDGTGAHTWVYGPVSPNGVAYPAGITDPDGNITALSNFVGVGYPGVPTTKQYFQKTPTGQQLLKTVVNGYSGGTSPFVYIDNVDYNINFVLTSSTTTWPNGQVSKRVITYDSGATFYDPNFPPSGNNSYPLVYGSVIQEQEYDYGSNSPGQLLRQTNTQFQWQGNGSFLTANLLSQPASVTVYDSASNSCKGQANTPCAQTTYAYDETGNGSVCTTLPCGNLTSVTRWLNGGTSPKTQYVYNSQGMRTKTFDPLNNQTLYTYDSTGAFLSRVQYPNTGSTTHIENFSYDLNTGLLSWHKDQNTQQTSFGYDSMRRIKSVTYPDGGSETYCYKDKTADSCPPTTVVPSFVFTKAINPTTNFIETGIVDGFGRPKQAKTTVPTSTCSSGYSYVDTTYDNEGRQFSVSNPYCTTGDATYGLTKTYYDTLNRVTSVVEQDGSTVSTDYSAFPCITVTDEAGKKRKSCPDGLGRMTSVSEDPSGLNYQTSYSYNALDDLLSVTQSGSRQRTFSYDSLSRLASATNPESGTITYSYDANGNLITKTAPAPNQTGTATVTTTHYYDVLNRLTAKVYNNSSPGVYYYYDETAPWGITVSNPIGRLTTMGTYNGTCWPTGSIFGYDPMGRPNYQADYLLTTNTSGCPGVADIISASYDLAGNQTSLTYPSGRVVKSQFNGVSRLTKVTIDDFNGYNYLSSANYAPFGSPTSFALGNGVTETSTYNNRLQPLNQQLANTRSALLNRSYGFTAGHNNGNVIGITDNLNSGLTQNFSYDSLNRIYTAQTTGTSGPSCWGQQFGYDTWGNLLTETPTIPGCPTNALSLGVNVKNQITNTGFSYDAAGNLLADGINSYSFDAESHLTSLNSGAATYTYDAQGRRVAKKIGSATTEYIYFNGNVLAEYNLGNHVWSDYIFTGGRRLAAAGTDDIFNPGFEQGLEGWAVGASDSSGSEQVITDPTRAHSGNNYLQLSTTTAQVVADNQIVAVNPGDQLTFGGWAYLESGSASGAAVGWNLIVRDANGNVLGFPVAGNATSATWTYQSYTYTVPSGGASVGLYAQIYLPTGSTTARFDDGFLTGASGIGTHYYHADHLGSARLMTDSAGNATWSSTYLPFGQEWNPQITVNHYKFTGKERDSESGLDNFGARYDSSQYGRFMSPDPENLGSIRDDPQSWNAYAYARNNPLKYTDPDGMNYRICDTTDHCQEISDEAFNNNFQNAKNVQLNGNQISIQDANGNFSKEGTFQRTSFDDLDARGNAFFNEMSARRDASNQLIATFAKESVKSAVAGAAVSQVIGAAAEAINAAKAGAEVPASTPVGRLGSPMSVGAGTNEGAEIGGRYYSGHALDSMQGRGLVPSVIEDTIGRGTASPGNTPGTIKYATEQAVVITNRAGQVVTAYPK